MYKAIGQITIEEGLELNNPTLEIVNSNYNWINNTVSIEAVFNEEKANYKHSRKYTFDLVADKEYTSKDIIGFINNHSILNVFK